MVMIGAVVWRLTSSAEGNNADHGVML